MLDFIVTRFGVENEKAQQLIENAGLFSSIMVEGGRLAMGRAQRLDGEIAQGEVGLL